MKMNVEKIGLSPSLANAFSVNKKLSNSMKILPKVLVFLFVRVDLQPRTEELIDGIFIVTVKDTQMKRRLTR